MQVFKYFEKGSKSEVYFLCIINFFLIFQSQCSHTLGEKKKATTKPFNCHLLCAFPNLHCPAMRLSCPLFHTNPSPSHCSPCSFLIRGSWYQEVPTPDLSHCAQPPGNCSSSLVPTAFQKRKSLWNSGLTFSLWNTMHVHSPGLASGYATMQLHRTLPSE